MQSGKFQYDKIIRELGDELIIRFDKKDSVLPGVNGPYNDEETVVRNLSHLIVITSIEIIVFKRKELKNQLKAMGELLIEEEGSNGLYVLRNKKFKDQCNGVIGHAWIMEAFVYLYKVFSNSNYIEKALDIYNKHDFNFQLGLWNRPSESTNIFNIDYTLNHQLWFAAISSELYEVTGNKNIKRDIDRFFKKLTVNAKMNFNGLICHSIIKKESKPDIIKAYIKRCLDVVNRLLKRPSYSYKENGYHIFNIAALGRLYKIFPQKKFWSSRKFYKIINYGNSDKLLSELLNPHVELDISLRNTISNPREREINIYGYPYNVPGFELYYSKQIFKDMFSDSVIDECLLKQFELTYDVKNNKFKEHCYDKVTINYRIYEYYKALEERD